MPDGYRHRPRQRRPIRTFPLNDTDTLYAPDVIAFAREKGWFKGADDTFSFADVYGPADSGDRRFCDAAGLEHVRTRRPRSAALPEFGHPRRPAPAPPLPLWIKPDRLVKPRRT